MIRYIKYSETRVAVYVDNIYIGEINPITGQLLK